VAGHARPLKFHADKIAKTFPGDQITDTEGDWFVGDLALTQLLQGELVRLRGRNANDHGSDFRRRMMMVALGKLFAGVRGGDKTVINLRVATGLPVSHMTDAAILKKELTGPHRVQTDQSDFVANIQQVMVMPQSYAALYTKTLTADGDINIHDTTTEKACIDIGTYTTDFARDQNGVYVDAESGSVEVGVYNIHERVAEELAAKYKQAFPYKVVEQVIRTKKITIAGKVEDCTEIVNTAIEIVRVPVVSKAYELWKDGLHIQEIALMGGGFLVPEITASVTEAYKQATLMPDPQWANALGYSYYAAFAAKD